MAVVHRLNYEPYEANESRYKPIASVIPLKRYKKLQHFLHDNTQGKGNKLFKVELILTTMHKKGQKIESEHDNWIEKLGQ